MSRFFTSVLAASAILFSTPGVRCAGAQAIDRVLDRSDSLVAAGLVEAGGAEAQLLHRQAALRLAREAYRLLPLDAAETDADSLPDPGTARVIGAWLDASARALLHEAIRLDELTRESRDDRGLEFRSLWSERVDGVLALLARWPLLWREPIDAGRSRIDLPADLTMFCTPQAYRGETFSLPRRHLFRRMAVLPDSIARCCLSERYCRSRTGAGCRAGVVAALARDPDLDLLVGFANTSAYWKLPRDTPPRDSSVDAMVAQAEVRAAQRLLAATRGGEPLPGGIDPSLLVPGLRNPRPDPGGGLVWDVILHRQAREIYARRWGESGLPALGTHGRLLDSD